MPSKLNWLLQNTSSGEVILQSWLTKHDISPQLSHKYAKNGWLTKLRSGVYFRPGKAPDWHNALHCLMMQLNTTVHIAGLTSLTYQGKSHYLQLHEKNIWLEIPPKTTLPLWFKTFPKLIGVSHSKPMNSAHSVKEPSIQYNAPNWLFVRSNKLLEDLPSDLIELEIKGTMLKASGSELATFELLNAVPDKISFEHAAEVFQGLTNLSPRKVQSLLSRSKSIKTNRLFLFLGNYYAHPWVARIDENKINMGSGKRQIIVGGVLDHTYQITVPDSFMNTEKKISKGS